MKRNIGDTVVGEPLASDRKFLYTCHDLRSRRCRLLALLLFVLGVAWGLATAVGNYRVYVELRDFGQTAIGQVAAQRFLEGGCGETDCTSDRYSIRYTFDVGGQVFIGQGIEPDRAYNEGDPINIIYSPGNPNLNRIAATNTFSLSDFGVMPLGVGALVVWLGFISLWFFINPVLYLVWRLGRRA